VDIEQASTNVCYTNTSVTLNLTSDSYLDGGTANWSSVPSGITSATFDPSSLTPTQYVVTAASSVLPGCSDTCIVEVIKVDIEQTSTNVCYTNTSVTLNLTSDSYLDGGTANWSSVPAGISSATFNPSSLTPTQYIVTAASSVLPGCSDTCIVEVIKVDIEQATTNVCYTNTSVTLNLTGDSYLDGGTANWSSVPAGISSATFDPSSLTPTQYVVTAASSVLPGCTDTCTVEVIKVDIEQAATNVCHTNTSVTLNLTGDSYLDGGTAIWSSVPAGISSATFNPSSLTPTQYVVTASSSVLPGCTDTCTVEVIKVDIEQTETNVCWQSTSVTLNLTTNSYLGGGTANWSSVPSGITSATFNPSTLPNGATQYVVTAASSVLPGCTDTCTVTVIKIAIDSVDANFAPSVEKLAVRYTIKPTGYTASFGKLEVFKNGDAVNPIFKDATITKTGTNVLYEWDGKANQGTGSGKYVGPRDSPYTIKVSISEVADYSSSCSDTNATKVEVESITLIPAGVENVVKPNRAATEIDKDVEALVKIKKKDGTGVLTELVLKVDWSFEDPDDTATAAGIDSNGGAGDDNAPIASGGKRGAASVMWKVIAGFTSTVNMNVADSETKVAGADKGKTKIQFSTSAISGDNYILVAQCKDAAGSVLKEKKSGTWSVRKTVDFPNIYNMNGGVDAGAMMDVANINPAFSSDGYTDYTRGGVTAVPAADSPEYLAPLLAPNAAEKPSDQELATYLATSTPDVNVAPLGDYPGPGDTDHDGDGNLDTSADVDVAPLGDFPGPGDTDHNGDGNLDRVATVADKNAAEVAITAKAQAWYTRNFNSVGTAAAAVAANIGAAGRAIIGAQYEHPKMDGRAASGATSHFPAGIVINAYGTGVVDPDASDWFTSQGLTVGGTVIFVYLNGGGAARQQIIGRHEVGHASDHVSFGPGDHAASDLMTPTGSSNTFSDDSILRLRGWSP